LKKRGKEGGEGSKLEGRNAVITPPAVKKRRRRTMEERHAQKSKTQKKISNCQETGRDLKKKTVVVEK